MQIATRMATQNDGRGPAGLYDTFRHAQQAMPGIRSIAQGIQVQPQEVSQALLRQNAVALGDLQKMAIQRNDREMFDAVESASENMLGNTDRQRGERMA